MTVKGKQPKATDYTKKVNSTNLIKYNNMSRARGYCDDKQTEIRNNKNQQINDNQ